MSVPQALDLGKDVNVVKLAREIAIDHYPIAEVLARYQIDEDTWDALNEWPRFTELVAFEKQQWHGALNTNARVRLKSATLIEEWMEEGDRYLHDKETSLNSKVELIKLLGKFAQLDAPAAAEAATAGGRITININMGTAQVAYKDEGPILDAVDYEESDPNAVEFDWEEEFPVNPVEGSEAIFEET
jgi:hypothetical protein